MNRTILVLLILVTASMAGFSDDQYVEQPDVLTRIMAAAEQDGSQFRSSTDGRSAYYLRSAEYIGPCKAPFGPVHIALRAAI